MICVSRAGDTSSTGTVGGEVRLETVAYDPPPKELRAAKIKRPKKKQKIEISAREKKRKEKEEAGEPGVGAKPAGARDGQMC